MSKVISIGASDFVSPWCPVLEVAKWDPDQVAYVRGKTGILEPSPDLLGSLIPPERIWSVGNLLTTAGLTRLVSRLISNSDIALANTTARIGVGDGSTAATVSDTDLAAAAGSSHRWFQVMDATYPQASAAVLTLRATFASADGNFAQSEWGIDIDTATVSSGNTVHGILFNRKVQALGTKVSGAVWQATATVTFS